MPYTYMMKGDRIPSGYHIRDRIWPGHGGTHLFFCSQISWMPCPYSKWRSHPIWVRHLAIAQPARNRVSFTISRFSTKFIEKPGFLSLECDRATYRRSHPYLTFAIAPTRGTALFTLSS
ncbi:MAG: hypothetical protein AB4352_08410 [Hormoscilla sp.]